MTGDLQGPVGPMLRRGPRPLLLHLSLAMLRSSGSGDGSPSSNGGSPRWSAPDPALVAGIAAYRRHPYRRVLADPPAVWAEGSARVLDYGGTEGPPVLFVPSLVNRAYALDLMEGRSLLRFLAGAGVRAHLLDWGFPGAAERGFSLTDLIAGRLERAVAALGAPAIVVGYCMGGLLSVALAQRRPDLVRGLGLLATPWDFHAPDPAAARRVAGALPLLEPAMGLTGTLPVDLLQMLFAMPDPWGIAEKYRAFGRMEQGSARAALFVALEDWLNDGIPLAAPVARECLSGWYGANAPAAGAWMVAGEAVDPGRLRLPAFVAIPARDRIVPPESARALAGRIAGAAVLEPRAGHVGMVAGSNAEAALWRPLLEWLGRA